MQLAPIGHDNIDAAVSVIRRGFADPPTATWSDMLQRFSSLQGSELSGPIGYLLRKDGNDVGIMLTLQSKRQQGRAPDVINLCSWYVDEAYRWYAPMMLKKILRDNDAAFTDLTASESVQDMLPALKFNRWTEGVLLTSLPQSFKEFRRDVNILGVDQLKLGQISDVDMTLLRDHQKQGCICSVMRIDDDYHPLIFVTRYRRKIPHAYLIYAPDRSAVLSAAGNVCAHLLKRGYFLFAMDCNADECTSIGTFRKASWHKFYNGPIDTKSVDYAYSELVYMGGS